MAWAIRGESNGVDISGCNVALVSHWLSTQITDINVFEDNGTIKAEVGEFGSIGSTRMVNEVGDTVAWDGKSGAVGHFTWNVQ